MVFHVHARIYVEQAFRRVCVRAGLLHGAENQRYLQAADFRLLRQGKAAKAKAPRDPAALTSMGVYEDMSAPTVHGMEASFALWGQLPHLPPPTREGVRGRRREQQTPTTSHAISQQRQLGNSMGRRRRRRSLRKMASRRTKELVTW